MFGTIRADLEKIAVPTTLIVSGLHAVDEAAYAKDLGVAADHLVTLDLGAITKLQVVPTLVLVNQRGEVMYSAEGIPTDPQRQDLLNAVASQPSAR